MATARCVCSRGARTCFPPTAVVSYRDVIAIAERTSCAHIAYNMRGARISYVVDTFADGRMSLVIPPQYVDKCLLWLSVFDGHNVRFDLLTECLTIDDQPMDLYLEPNKHGRIPNPMFCDPYAYIAMCAAVHGEHLMY